MRLLKFRVRNYKSIRDSGDCWLASDLTILAGKNESGKTAILEALRDFDPRESISEAARPIDRTDAPLLEATFELDHGEVGELLASEPPDLQKIARGIISREGLVLLKDDGGRYRFGDALTEAIEQADAEEAGRAALAEAVRADAARRDAEERARLEAESEAAEDDDEEAEDEEAEDEEADDDEDEEEEEAEEQREPLLERVVKRIPRFVFFSSFDQVLPFEITFTKARSNQSVQDFAKVAGLDLPAVSKISDTQTRKNVLAKHSAELSGNFKQFWHQEVLKLTASAEGQTLILGIEEEGRTHTFKAEQRSKGLQWFLAFYLRLRAEGGYQRVILIDEPGLYLHARAQQDVLEVFEELAAQAQIVFSTHSPYLLDPDRLDRIRLVVKDGDSVIQGKVHAGADMETLTPIITAVGLDAANQFSVAGSKNVVLEGITDYFYLQALRIYVAKELHEGLSLIPTVGAQNVPKIVSLLIGWNLKFAAVLDNDGEGRKVAQTLRDDLSVDETQIIFASNTSGQSTEDLFTKSEFKRLILNESGPAHEASNSKQVKSGGYDSVLLARLFFAKVKADPDSIKLAKSTVQRAEELFGRIATAVGGSDLIT